MVVGTVHIFALNENMNPAAGGALPGPPPPPQQQQVAFAPNDRPLGGGSSAQPNIDQANQMMEGDAQGTPQSSNKSLSGLSFLRGVLPGAIITKNYATEWSFAQVGEFWYTM
jgi:hypothetical protein